MRRCKLKVYIGDVISNKNPEANVTIYIKEPYFPKGDLEGDVGIDYNNFKIFKNAATFIVDLSEALNVNLDDIFAEVEMNIKSCKKSMNGFELVKFLDNLSDYKGDYKLLRNFSFL